MGDIIATIVLIVIAFLTYLLPAVPLSFPILYFGRRRAQFKWWELSALLVPFSIWVCFWVLSRDKSLGNLVEALILGAAIPIAASLRVLIGVYLNRILVVVSLMIGQSVLAVLLGTMFEEVPFHWFH